MNFKGVIVGILLVGYVIFSNIDLGTNKSINYETNNYLSNSDNLSFNANLEVPGDHYEYKYVSKNNSDYDMILDRYTKEIYEDGVLLNSVPKFLKFTIYNSNNEEVRNGEILKKNSKNTYIVKLEYRKDINPEDLPSEDHKYNFSIKMNFVQKVK